MDLFLRPTVIGGDTLKADFVVIHEDRRVGRIRLAGERDGHRGITWDWFINIPLAIPPGCTGTAASLDDAKAAFKTAWEKFLPTLTERQIRLWHDSQDTADRWGK